MSQEPDSSPLLVPPPGLRSYRAPWRGELVLVCRKCQRKIKKHKGNKRLANLKKWFKKRGKSEEAARELRVVGMDCVKMCPKDAVTVVLQHRLCDPGREVFVVRSQAELEGLYTIASGATASADTSDRKCVS